MKTHKFDVEDAKKYGVEKAILLEHLRFHQQANEGSDDLFFNGKTYAFIKPSTIKEMYPYLSYPSVRRWLKELENDGIIESFKPKAKGGYHLKYYHVLVPNDQNDQSNDQNEHSLNDQNDQSSNITNVNNHVNYVQFVDFWNEVNDCNLRITDKKRESIRARLRTFSEDEIKESIVNRSKDDWINGEGLKYKTDWMSFWRNDEKVERYLNKTNNHEPTSEELERRYRLKPE